MSEINIQRCVQGGNITCQQQRNDRVQTFFSDPTCLLLCSLLLNCPPPHQKKKKKKKKKVPGATTGHKKGTRVLEKGSRKDALINTKIPKFDIIVQKTNKSTL